MMMNTIVAPPLIPEFAVVPVISTVDDRSSGLCPPDTTLWMGNISPDWTPEFIITAFKHFGRDVRNVKRVTDKITGGPASYCFVEFNTPEDARQVMLQVNGRTIPNDVERRRFHLSFANAPNSQSEYNLYITNLSSSVDESALFKLFGEKYASCRGAKIYRHPNGDSKESGFVRFTSETDQQMALVEMNKLRVKGREIELKLAGQRGRVRLDGTRPTRGVGSYGRSLHHSNFRSRGSSQYDRYRPYGHNDRDSYRTNRYSSRHNQHTRSSREKSPLTRKNCIQDVDPPTTDEHNEYLLKTEYDFQTSIDIARWSRILVPSDLKSRDLAVKLYELM
ncbi:hypothetical protein M3Y98_00594700 [Aphelenchoides besseyi]|nr:hypothetical protein M3Y98_00594700 [Aphelenchoides besseyi]KAI6194010.1 hypothetical protein M3Y96_01079700 [Aphelenchoides besseyi]